MTKSRPDVLQGKTRKLKTGCGNLYVTVNELNGKPVEVFCKLGKAGGCSSSQVETMGRLISLALRAGVEMGVIVRQLQGISCHQTTGFGNSKITSCSDGVAKVLVDWAKEIPSDVEWMKEEKDDHKKS